MLVSLSSWGFDAIEKWNGLMLWERLLQGIGIGYEGEKGDNEDRRRVGDKN